MKLLLSPEKTVSIGESWKGKKRGWSVVYCERYHVAGRGFPGLIAKAGQQRRKETGYETENTNGSTHKHRNGPQNTGELCRTRTTKMIKQETSMEIVTLQPTNRLKGENGHDRRTPQRAEKGTGDPLNASSPTQRKEPHMAALCGRDLVQDAVAEPPGIGVKFRKNRENNPPKGLKD